MLRAENEGQMGKHRVVEHGPGTESRDLCSGLRIFPPRPDQDPSSVEREFIHYFDISSAEVICAVVYTNGWFSSLIHDFSFRVQDWNVPLSFPFSSIKIKAWEVGEYGLSYYLDPSSNFIPLLFSVHGVPRTRVLYFNDSKPQIPQEDENIQEVPY